MNINKFQKVSSEVDLALKDYKNFFKNERLVDILLLLDNKAITEKEIKDIIKNQKYSIIKKNNQNETVGQVDISLKIGNKYIFGDTTLAKEKDFEGNQIINHFLSSAYLVADNLNFKNYKKFSSLDIDSKIHFLGKKIDIDFRSKDIFKTINSYFHNQKIDFSYTFYAPQHQKSEKLIGTELFVIYEMLKNKYQDSFLPIDSFKYISNEGITDISKERVCKIVEGLYGETNKLRDFSINNKNDKDHLMGIVEQLSKLNDNQLSKFLKMTVGVDKYIEITNKIENLETANGMTISLHAYLLDILETKSTYDLNYLNISSQHEQNLSNLYEIFKSDKNYLHPQSNNFKNTVNLFNKEFNHLEHLNLSEISYPALNINYKSLSALDKQSFDKLRDLDITGFPELDKPVHTNTDIVLPKIYNLLERYRNKEERENIIKEYASNSKIYAGRKVNVSDIVYEAIVQKVSELDHSLTKNLSKKMVEIFLNSNNKQEFLEQTYKINLNEKNNKLKI